MRCDARKRLPALAAVGLASAASLASALGPDAMWDAGLFGRGRLPRIDDRLRPLEWGQLQILHTTDIHGCMYQG